jgi:2-polyprenyl-3-methyl-5-hydroxy-6-metoxy-1,4-benzoquinol methylase
MTTESPNLSDQGKSWAAWAVESDRGETRGDPEYCSAISRFVRSAMERSGHGRAADVGCGTGWLTEVLAERFDHVWGVELGEDSLDVARKRLPQCEFVAGDFLAVPLPEPVNFCVSCEVVAHVENQALFFERLRDLVVPGGRIVLVSQNPFVWSRNSWLTPPDPNRLRKWLPLSELRAHLERVGFSVERTTTVEPVGDRGLLFWRPYVNGVVRRIIGRANARRLFESMGLGRSYVIEASR